MARGSRRVISNSAQNARLYPVITGFFAKPAMKSTPGRQRSAQTAEVIRFTMDPESAPVAAKNVGHLPDRRLANMSDEMVDEGPHFG